ncbi:Desmin [Oryzias melastigma]|uniref:Desmin n=1 Tax=Oryzias melastigma TaxID=30732 RepID=A0A834FQI1_ORYME|nr:Desmin [Oryzias melastigma]
MLPFKRTFDSEKQQLQELNSRLVQYLSRTKQLEQENARLITEISHLKQVKQSPERPQNYRAETRDLRRMVEQLAFEKSQAELEREKLWRELQTLQSACSEQSVACRDISWGAARLRAGAPAGAQGQRGTPAAPAAAAERVQARGGGSQAEPAAPPPAGGFPGGAHRHSNLPRAAGGVGGRGAGVRARPVGGMDRDV